MTDILALLMSRPSSVLYLPAACLGNLSLSTCPVIGEGRRGHAPAPVHVNGAGTGIGIRTSLSDYREQWRGVTRGRGGGGGLPELQTNTKLKTPEV